MSGLTQWKNVSGGCLPPAGESKFYGLTERDEIGMRYIIKFLSGIGFVTMLIGMGAMDSESKVVPMILAFAGVGVFYGFSRLEDWIYG